MSNPIMSPRPAKQPALQAPIRREGLTILKEAPNADLEYDLENFRTFFDPS